MKVHFLSFALVSLMTFSAQAAEIPRYDVEAHCGNVSKMSGGSNMIYNSCINMEQKAYNQIKAIWASIPAKTQNHCNQVGSVSGGSYKIFESCINMEMQAKQKTSTFKY